MFRHDFLRCIFAQRLKVAVAAQRVFVANIYFLRNIALLEMYKMKKRDQKSPWKLRKIPPPEYKITNGVRSVTPYVHEYNTSVKGRWLGRGLLEVLTTEFGGHSPVYWLNAISTGRVLINENSTTKDYIFQNNDRITHKTHRHEAPVQGAIELVAETADLVAVNKPSSMAVHPCGAYNHNTLLHIIRHEPIIKNQPNLLLVHRLDRVTSGIVILAKYPAAASRIQKEMMENRTKKTYLARVKGKFPQCLDKLSVLSAEALTWDHSLTLERTRRRRRRKKTESQSNNREDIDINANKTVNSTTGEFKIDYSELSDDVYKHPEVGYGYNDDGSITLRSAIGVVNLRDGVHSNNPEDGKPAYTIFRPLGYNDTDDTSLIECQPLTGRTHQIRLHLQLIGNPIANDPCYGGELFFGELSKKDDAISALLQIEAMGKQPLGNVSHVLKLLLSSGYTSFVGRDRHDTTPLSVEPKTDSGIDRARADGNIVDSKPCTNEGWSLAPDTAAVSVGEAEPNQAHNCDETDDKYLIRTCRYCINGLDEDLERVLHCDGIWLHALQYEGADWKFRTSIPSWAHPFMGGDTPI